VGRVTSFALAGLELWFNSDDHMPPHFHAERPGEWEVRVYFLRDRADMCETRWTTRRGRPSQGDLSRLAGLAEANRVALATEWELKVHIKTPGGER
jgi:hypothetical protein